MDLAVLGKQLGSILNNFSNLNLKCHLDFCKTFDMVFISKLGKHGFERCAILWIRNWMDGHRELWLMALFPGGQ